MNNTNDCFDEFQKENISVIPIDKAFDSVRSIRQMNEVDQVRSIEISDGKNQKTLTNKRIQEMQNSIVFKKMNSINNQENQKDTNVKIKNRISYRQTLYMKSKNKSYIQNLAVQRILRNIKDKRMLTTPIGQRNYLKFILKRERNSIIQPQNYLLYTKQQKKFLIAAKRIANIFRTTYLLSTNKSNVSQEDDRYLGKICSDFYRTEWLMFDEGFNPKKVRNLEQCRKQLAFVKFQGSLMGLCRRRILKIVIPSVNSELKPFEIRPSIQQNLLKQYFEQKSTNIQIYHQNIEKAQKQQRVSYDLILKDSVIKQFHPKNFIITKQSLPKVQEAKLSFYSITEQEYFLQVSYPFSVVQAFAIALSNLENKMLVQ